MLVRVLTSGDLYLLDIGDTSFILHKTYQDYHLAPLRVSQTYPYFICIESVSHCICPQGTSVSFHFLMDKSSGHLHFSIIIIVTSTFQAIPAIINALLLCFRWNCSFSLILSIIYYSYTKLPTFVPLILVYLNPTR